jgi:hypothetical protein
MTHKNALKACLAMECSSLDGRVHLSSRRLKSKESKDSYFRPELSQVEGLEAEAEGLPSRSHQAARQGRQGRPEQFAALH